MGSPGKSLYKPVSQPGALSEIGGGTAGPTLLGDVFGDFLMILDDFRMIFDDFPNIQNESKGFKQILEGGADRSARKARAAIGAERLVHDKQVTSWL